VKNEVDLSQISKEDLLKILCAQAQRAAFFQAEPGELSFSLNKSTHSPALPLITSQLPSIEARVDGADSLISLKPGLPPSNHPGDSPTSYPDDRVIEIKPKWRTQNRLQNCHAPKPK